MHKDSIVSIVKPVNKVDTDVIRQQVIVDSTSNVTW